MLRQSGDPEFRVLARILSRKVRTRVTVKFVEGRGRKLRAPLPVPTSEGKMSRREIAENSGKDYEELITRDNIVVTSEK